MTQPHDQQPTRDGLTLVELLVVITILVILVAVVLPLAQPALKGREIREAARQVNAVFAGARARAAATGRPVGVVLVPQSGVNNRCYQLAYAKTPPPFTGSDTGVTAKVDDMSVLRFSDDLPASDPEPQTGDTARLMRKLVGNFCRIRFNFRGLTYDVQWTDGTYKLVDDQLDLIDPLNLPPDVVGPKGAAASFRGTLFQVIRPPRRSAAAPVDLPAGAYIDLDASGFESAGALGMLSNNGNADVYVMFNPEGSVTEVFNSTTVPVPFNANLFLLIANGKLAGPVNPSQAEIALNFTDSMTITNSLSAAADFPNLRPTAGSLWAIVNHRTGTVRTTDNLGPSTMQANDIQNLATYVTALDDARQFARAGSDKGGR